MEAERGQDATPTPVERERNSRLTSFRKSAIDASNPWQFGGLTMQTFSKMLLYVVLACLLLLGGNVSRRARPPVRGSNHFGREHHRPVARLRRCGQDNPVQHPVRPCKNGLLPPDEDDDDGERDRSLDNSERLLSLSSELTHHARLPAHHSRPLPAEVPLYQTLCILLI